MAPENPLDSIPLVQFLDGNLIYVVLGALALWLVLKWAFGLAGGSNSSYGGGPGSDGDWGGGGDGGGGGGDGG